MPSITYPKNNLSLTHLKKKTSTYHAQTTSHLSTYHLLYCKKFLPINLPKRKPTIYLPIKYRTQKKKIASLTYPNEDLSFITLKKPITIT